MRKTLIPAVLLYGVAVLIVSGFPRKDSEVVGMRVADGLHKFHVSGFVNMVALIGPEGVLLVDSGFEESADEVRGLLTGLDAGEIRFIINTHSDYDHIAGNRSLGRSACVLAHDNCRTRLLEYAGPDSDIPFDKAIVLGASPSITFAEPLAIHFNGEDIRAIPMIGGHTDEDVVVQFVNAGVVCLGDMVMPGSFPVVKLENGGNALVLLKRIEEIMALFPDESVFIVGHGRDMRMDDLRAYHRMLKGSIAVIKEAMGSGMSLEEMKRNGLLEEWMDYHDPENHATTSEGWIETVYLSHPGKGNDGASAGDIPGLRGPYLGQPPPGLKARIFLDGIISKTGEPEMSAAFTKDGREFYFCARHENSWAIYSSVEKDGRWPEPKPLPFTESRYTDRDLTISPDGKRIYFGSDRPIERGGRPRRRLQVTYIERTRNGSWSLPLHAGKTVNGGHGGNYPSVAGNGNLYFFTSRPDGVGKCDIFIARFEDGRYSPPVALGRAVNSSYNDWDSFIAPDESYIIFSSQDRPDTHGDQDLYISFRKPDGEWTEAHNMGASVNSESSEICPSVTIDGRFLFFTSRLRVTADIYWVDARIIDQVRSEVFK